MIDFTTYPIGKSLNKINSDSANALLTFLFSNKINECSFTNELCTFYLNDTCCYALYTGDAECIYTPIPFEKDEDQLELF